MWSKLEEAFEQLGLPYSRQGSYSDDDDELPPSFFTFWNMDTPEGGFYDNKAHDATWFWMIYFYTKNASILYSKLDELITILKQKGFIVEGRGKDISSNEPDYFGRCVQIKYVEKYNS